MAQLIREHNVRDLSLITIDEISNVGVHILARLSSMFKQIMEDDSKEFDGVPVLLVGDLGQKGPVQGTLVTQVLMDRVKRIEEAHKKAETFFKRTGLTSKRNPKTTSRSKCFSSARTSNEIGCDIFALSKWFQLVQQKRSNDRKHNKLLLSLIHI